MRGREGVEQDDTGTYALRSLFHPAVFGSSGAARG